MSLHLTTTFLFADALLNHLKDWDTACFIKINRDWSSAFADAFMPLMRDQRTWYPLYTLLLIYAIVKFKWNAVPFILLGIVTVGLSDGISSHIFKDWVGRVRPCNEVKLADIIKVRVGYRPMSGSFTSSHAANHFSLATYFYLTLKPYLKKWSLLFFLWAGVISYAQVYVGVHYPGDVLCGAILGVLVGLLTFYCFKKYFDFHKNPFRKKLN